MPKLTVKDKHDPTKRFPVKPFCCTVCSKTVSLPTWGKKRKYCSMTCSQKAIRDRLAKEKPKVPKPGRVIIRRTFRITDEF